MKPEYEKRIEEFISSCRGVSTGKAKKEELHETRCEINKTIISFNVMDGQIGIWKDNKFIGRVRFIRRFFYHKPEDKLWISSEKGTVSIDKNGEVYFEIV